MPEPRRDDPIEPPLGAPREPEPVAAAADEVSELAAMRATIELYRREKEALRAQLAERDARDLPVWLPLKRAAGNLDMPYENARSWAERAIKAGRVNEARKIDGRVEANINALKAYRDRLTAK